MSTATAAGSSGKAVASDPDRILPVNVFADICGIVMLIILLDGFPDRIGVIRNAHKPGSYLPLLSPEFRAYIPLLNFWWGIALALALVHLHNGRWTNQTRLFDVMLRLLAAVILFRLLTIGPIVGPPPSWAFQGSLSGIYFIRMNERMVPTLNLSIKVFLFFLFVAKLVGIYVHYRRLFRRTA